jgi:hypothetical protein
MSSSIVGYLDVVFYQQRMETYKFQKMVDRKFDEFIEKYDDYFGMKMLEGMMTTVDVILYIENKPEENCTPLELEARVALKEFRKLHEEFHALVAINKQRSVDFRTKLSTVL